MSFFNNPNWSIFFQHQKAEDSKQSSSTPPPSFRSSPSNPFSPEFQIKVPLYEWETFAHTNKSCLAWSLSSTNSPVLCFQLLRERNRYTLYSLESSLWLSLQEQDTLIVRQMRKTAASCSTVTFPTLHILTCWPFHLLVAHCREEQDSQA